MVESGSVTAFFDLVANGGDVSEQVGGKVCVCVCVLSREGTPKSSKSTV